MATNRRHSRSLVTGGAAVMVAAALAAAFWPRAVLVDTDAVRVAPMLVTINEEGRTRVRQPYVVSSPIAGELQRVTLQPGDPVVRGETVVARMRPVNPAALDIRTREQAHAAVEAAQAALRVAKADLNKAIANRDFAKSELERVGQLVERNITSQVALERAEQEARVAEADVETVRAAIAMREAELAQARAQLIGFDDLGLSEALAGKGQEPGGIPLRSPIDGTILKVLHKSKTTLPAGEPIVEIGDVTGDLEVVAELLSSDAVRVRVGNRVIITNWGGARDLSGTVTRIDPYGYTKFSALGVEEQRVETTVRFTDQTEDRGGLGHGYRVELRIAVWESDAATVVPSPALFRHGEGWAVFRVVNNRAERRVVRIGQNNGTQAEVLEGLSTGDEVILFPSASLSQGQKVARRQAP
jgi:HlyD family secretion protein